MNRSMRAALGVVLVALAVPTVALATHHPVGGFRHHGHRHGRSVGAPTTGAGTVQSYDGQTGALTLQLPGNGGTITGTVTDRTRFECPHSSQGNGWGRGGRRHGVLLASDTGPSGPSGASGSTGSTGSTGSSGDTGASGSTGSSGDTGASGSSGDTARADRPGVTAGTGRPATPEPRAHGTAVRPPSPRPRLVRRLRATARC